MARAAWARQRDESMLCSCPYAPITVAQQCQDGGGRQSILRGGCVDEDTVCIDVHAAPGVYPEPTGKILADGADCGTTGDHAGGMRSVLPSPAYDNTLKLGRPPGLPSPARI